MSGWGSIYRNASYAMSTHSEALARLQTQISTGQRVLRASDDPDAANRILKLNSQSTSYEGYMGNLQRIVLSLEDTGSALEQISSALIDARERVTQAGTGTLNPVSRTAIAGEIDSLLERVFSLANHTSSGGYLFGGDNVGVAPYKATRVDGKIVRVEYQGSDRELEVPVSRGATQSGLVVGEEIFRSNLRQSPQFLGATGAAAGSGTSSVQGDVWLTAEHTNTTYAAGAHGLAAGTTSAAADTILGEHTLTVSSSKSIRLDGGPAVSFTGTETNLEVTNAAGDVVHVDVSGWSGGNETVTITGQGRLSVDDGQTRTALTDFTTDAVVTDGQSGRVLYVDPTGFERQGVEPIRVPGTYGVFDSLIAVRDLMLNERGLSDTEQLDLLSRSLGALSEGITNIGNGTTTVGSRLHALDRLEGTLDDLQFNADSEAALIGDADLVQVITDMTRTQTLYQMTLATASKMLSLSLLDFMG